MALQTHARNRLAWEIAVAWENQFLYEFRRSTIATSQNIADSISIHQVYAGIDIVAT